MPDPAFGGPPVAVRVLIAAALADAWPDLDAFEGPGHRRLLIPVLHRGHSPPRRLHTVANICAAAGPGQEHTAR